MSQMPSLLRAARHKVGLSQKDLRAGLAARGIFVSQPTISHYETGMRVPGTMEEVVALAQMLHIDQNRLIDHFADQRASHARAAYLEKLIHEPGQQVLHLSDADRRSQQEA